MTHEEACKQLEGLARALKLGWIGWEAWYGDVDRIITAVEQRANAPQPERAYAHPTPSPSTHTYIVGGSPLPEAGSSTASSPARVAVLDAP